MKNLLLVLFGLMILSGCSGSGGGSTAGSSGHAAPYYISGTVQDNNYPGASRQIHLVVDNDTTIGNGNVAENAILGTTGVSMSVTGLAAGTYFVYAWKDVDVNGVFGSGDNYTGSPITVVVTNDDVILGSNVLLDTVQP